MKTVEKGFVIVEKGYIYNRISNKIYKTKKDALNNILSGSNRKYYTVVTNEECTAAEIVRFGE